jgi:hypothetical protein
VSCPLRGLLGGYSGAQGPDFCHPVHPGSRPFFYGWFRLITVCLSRLLNININLICFVYVLELSGQFVTETRLHATAASAADRNGRIALRGRQAWRPVEDQGQFAEQRTPGDRACEGACGR